MKPPVTDLLSFFSFDQSVSELALTVLVQAAPIPVCLFVCGLIFNPQYLVFDLYLSVIFINCQCRVVGFAIVAPNMPVAYATSGVVQSAGYLISTTSCLHFAAISGMYSSLSSGAWYSILVLYMSFVCHFFVSFLHRPSFYPPAGVD